MVQPFAGLVWTLSCVVVMQAPSSRKYLAPTLSDGATRQDKMSAVMGVKKRRTHTSNYSTATMTITAAAAATATNPPPPPL